jgi:tetratricopeptide (TPR) repeat protein
MLLSIGVVWSDTQNKAFWMIFEQGNTLMERNEFGEALKAYKEAIAVAGVFPEAEIAIGDIYAEEGELDLAKAQYEKAYNQRNAFSVPASKYDALYRLASVYENQEYYKLMEDSLLRIVADDLRFADQPSSHLRTQIEKNYFEKGLDHVLVLYRFDEPFSAAAHSKLGWFYYKTGRFALSVTHYLYAVIYRASEIANYLRDRDIEFEFSTLEELLNTAQGRRELLKYIAEKDLFRDLYYLAGSTYADGYPQHSLGMWKLIARFPSAGQYVDLSLRQIKKPWTEPFIVNSSTAKKSP